MKSCNKTLIALSLFILCLYGYAEADYWERVVSNGFGEPNNDYAWSMKEFKGHLYVGTLNFLRGGEIWRSSTGEPNTWQRVYNGHSFGNLGIRYLYVDLDQTLYACTLNGLGAEILRTKDGQKWTRVNKLGIMENAAFRCMVRFEEYLYAGAGSDGAQLHRSKDGSRWELVKTKPSFQATEVFDQDTGLKVPNNTMIGELAIFNGQLYAFTWTREVKYRDIVGGMCGQKVVVPKIRPTSPGAFEVYRSSDGVNWEKVVGLGDHYGNGMGFCLLDPDGWANDVVTSAIVFKDQLYLGTLNIHGNSSIWRTSEGTRWSKVLDFFSLGERANYYVWRMINFREKLFIGTMNVGSTQNPEVTGAQIWVSDSGDPDTFHNLVRNGFDGKIWSDGDNIEIPKNIGIRSFEIFHGDLFTGTATIISTPIRKHDLGDRMTIVGHDVGCEVWRLLE